MKQIEESNEEAMTSLKHMTSFWDNHVNGWLNGNNALSDPLDGWFKSYAGKGRGEVTLEGMPEPWIGDLTSPERARLVILGLNPGDYRPAFQARTGIYAEQVRELGSYTQWAAKNPYLLEPWKKEFGINRYHLARQQFARRWLGDPDVPESAVVLLELYPWHSTGVTGLMRPDRDIIQRFVLDPIGEFSNVRDIFAFGKPWSSRLENLGLPLIDKLGNGIDERDYGSSVASRSLRVYQLPCGKRIIVEWHSGSAGPPSAKETALLKAALA
jgi:hypothetical protein